MSQEPEKSRDFSRILENWEVSMNGWEVKREMAIPIWQERIKACRASGMGVGAQRTVLIGRRITGGKNSA